MFVFLDEFEMETARLVGEQTELALKRTISVLRGEPCPGVAMIDKETVDPSTQKTREGCDI